MKAIASSCASNGLCSLMSCHLLTYIVHKPVSKAQPKAQNTFVEMWILGVGELSTPVFRTSQQLYYFIWTDLREYGPNRKVLSKATRQVLQGKHLEFIPYPSAWTGLGAQLSQHGAEQRSRKYIHLLKENNSLMSTQTFLVSKSCIIRMLWWIETDHSAS